MNEELTQRGTSLLPGPSVPGIRPQAYPPELRQRYFEAYALTGSVSKALELVSSAGLPEVAESTIYGWLQLPEAGPFIDSARRAFARRMSAIDVDLIEIASKEIRDRLVSGDHRLTKDGTTVRVPMSGRDIAVVKGIHVDKQAVWSELAGDVGMTPSDMTPEKLAEAEASLAKHYAEKLRRSQANAGSVLAEVEVSQHPPEGGDHHRLDPGKTKRAGTGADLDHQKVRKRRKDAGTKKGRVKP